MEHGQCGTPYKRREAQRIVCHQLGDTLLLHEKLEGHFEEVCLCGQLDLFCMEGTPAVQNVNSGIALSSNRNW